MTGLSINNELSDTSALSNKLPNYDCMTILESLRSFVSVNWILLSSK